MILSGWLAAIALFTIWLYLFCTTTFGSGVSGKIRMDKQACM
ncbi:MAG TPA: hypothetical protein V6D19_01385 [Stenomitos sp.]